MENKFAAYLKIRLFGFLSPATLSFVTLVFFLFSVSFCLRCFSSYSSLILFISGELVKHLDAPSRLLGFGSLGPLCATCGSGRISCGRKIERLTK